MRESIKGIRVKHQKSIKDIIKSAVIILAASFVYAAGISLFLDPNDLAPGGVSGISIMLSRFTGISTGTLILIFNIPLLLIGAWKFGKSFAAATLYAIVLSSGFMNLLEPIGALTEVPLLAALAGSTLVAAGISFVFKAGATTGGMDIIVRLLRLKYKHLKTGFIFLIIDMVIVAASGIVFGAMDIALYASIAVICNAIVMDTVLYGTDEAKMIYIISDQSEKIAAYILSDMEIGITFIEGRGAYSHKKKDVILCIVKKPQFPLLEEIVKEIDSEAFMIVTKATEIFGEGYKNFFAQKL